MSTTDERDEAKHDLVLADIEKRIEEVRQMKSYPLGTYEGWKVAFAGLTAGAAIFGAGAALGALLLHLGGHG
jgi:hypothetical protein